VVADFEIIPAIDVLGGKCVRLTQGDYARSSVFFDEPAEAAARWTELGAATIHLVDLDGAREGRPVNLPVLRAIRAVTGATLQYGGGLRDDDAINAALDAGADRLVVGTALIHAPDWVERLCQRFAERVVVGIDARDGRVAGDGWLAASGLTILGAVERANAIGVRRALFTDISRDGTLEGPNVASLRSVVAAAHFAVIASGGVASVEDLVEIRRAGAAAAIVGKALYSGRVDLADAIARLRATEGAGERC